METLYHFGRVQVSTGTQSRVDCHLMSSWATDNGTGTSIGSYICVMGALAY